MKENMQEKIIDFLINNGAGQVGFCRLDNDDFGTNDFNLKYAISGLPAGPYTVKNLKPVVGILYNLE